MKKQINNILKISLAAVITLAPSVNYAALIPYSIFNEYETINAQTKELNLSVFEKAHMVSMQYQFKMENYVPYASLPQYDNGRRVANEILKKTINTLLDSDFANQNLALSQIENLNNTLSTSVDAANYKLKFRFRPSDTAAEVKIESFVNASLSYDVTSDEVALELSKKFDDKAVSFKMQNDSGEQSNVLAVTWNF